MFDISSTPSFNFRLSFTVNAILEMDVLGPNLKLWVCFMCSQNIVVMFSPWGTQQGLQYVRYFIDTVLQLPTEFYSERDIRNGRTWSQFKALGFFFVVPKYRGDV
jgi:hypothetical protein